MTVSLYVNGWHEQPSHQVKQYCTDEWPSLPESFFAGESYSQDEDGRYFKMVTVYDTPFPEANFSNALWSELYDAIGFDSKEDSYNSRGTAELEDIPAYIRTITKLLNTRGPERMATPGSTFGGERAVEHEGNVATLTRTAKICFFGHRADRISGQLHTIRDLLMFAQARGAYAYWG